MVHYELLLSYASLCVSVAIESKIWNFGKWKNRDNAKMTWTSDKVRLKTRGQNALIKHANESSDLNLQFV